MKPRYQPVLVEWLDSTTLSKWGPVEEYQKAARPSTCVSMGFLLLEDDERLVILQTIDGDETGDVMAALAIPRTCVLRIRHLYPKGGKW